MKKLLAIAVLFLALLPQLHLNAQTTFQCNKVESSWVNDRGEHVGAMEDNIYVEVWINQNESKITYTAAGQTVEFKVTRKEDWTSSNMKYYHVVSDKGIKCSIAVDFRSNKIYLTQMDNGKAVRSETLTYYKIR